MDAIRDKPGVGLKDRQGGDLDQAETLTDLGIALAGQGRLDEAELSFRQVVRLQPDRAGAHNHLGAVLAAQEKWDEAIAHYQQAIRLRPDFDAAYGNLAGALRERGQVEDALEYYHQALRLKPDSAETHYSLGNALRSQGRHAEALVHYGRALELRPDAVEVSCRLASLLAAEGRQGEALRYAREALRLEPRSHATFFDLGTTFLRLGHFDEAVAYYGQALRLRPDDPDTLNNLGTALWEQGRLEEAEAHYQQAVRLRPDDPDLLNNLGNALREQGRAEGAADCYRQALRLRPDLAETLMNLGVVLTDLGELDEAVASIRQAIRLRSDWPAAHDNLGTTLGRQGKLDEALDCFEQALRLHANYPEAHRNRAMAWLSQGDFERGWPEYEWRLKCRGRAMPPPFSQPRWEGEPLAGRTILLHAEQGLGDTLQFIRYASMVKQRGGIVLVVCPQPQARLLACCPGIDQVLVAGSPLPAFDVHAPLLSLPMILGTTVATVPAEVPYLFADAAGIEQWRHKLVLGKEFRIGIAWQGNPRHRSDRQRSFPLAMFAHLARLVDVRLISLQKGTGTEQLRELEGRFAVTELDGWGDFLETAAMMRNLDLVVTPDTAVAHLAGGLGVRVWVALPLVAEWRWLADREDSPWYPTMRLFRQTRAGDWDEVFRRIAEALDRELGLCSLDPQRIR